MAEKKHALYHPETGEKYETTDAVEATRLRVAHGYTDKAPKKADTSGESKKK